MHGLLALCIGLSHPRTAALPHPIRPRGIYAALYGLRNPLLQFRLPQMCRSLSHRCHSAPADGGKATDPIGKSGVCKTQLHCTYRRHRLRGLLGTLSHQGSANGALQKRTDDSGGGRKHLHWLWRLRIPLSRSGALPRHLCQRKRKACAGRFARGGRSSCREFRRRFPFLKARRRNKNKGSCVSPLSENQKIPYAKDSIPWALVVAVRGQQPRPESLHPGCRHQRAVEFCGGRSIQVAELRDDYGCLVQTTEKERDGHTRPEEPKHWSLRDDHCFTRFSYWTTQQRTGKNQDQTGDKRTREKRLPISGPVYGQTCIHQSGSFRIFCLADSNRSSAVPVSTQQPHGQQNQKGIGKNEGRI